MLKKLPVNLAETLLSSSRASRCLPCSRHKRATLTAARSSRGCVPYRRAASRACWKGRYPQPGETVTGLPSVHCRAADRVRPHRRMPANRGPSRRLRPVRIQPRSVSRRTSMLPRAKRGERGLSISTLAARHPSRPRWISAIPSSASPCIAFDQPRKILPTATQYGKPFLARRPRWQLQPTVPPGQVHGGACVSAAAA